MTKHLKPYIMIHYTLIPRKDFYCDDCDCTIKVRKSLNIIKKQS